MTAVHRHTPVTEALNALIQKMTQQTDLTPEPWALHLLGFITPLLVIAGNLLGGAYTAMGVVFVWFVGPVLDIFMGESRNPRPARESGSPFKVLLWMHGLMHFLVLASFFRFAYLEASLSFGFLLRYCRPVFRQRLLLSSPLMRWGTESQKVLPIS